MRREQGQNLIELALILPLLLFLIGIAIDVGRGMQAYVVLQNAAREAVRYASAHPLDTNGVVGLAQEEIKRGGLSPANATINVTGTGEGNPVRITITYRMPILFILLGRSEITLQAKAEAVIY